MIAAGADLEGARERLAATGRARIDGFLEEAVARDLAQILAGEGMAWRRSLDNLANVDVPVALFEAQPPEEQARLIARVHEGAREDFQYLFDRLPIDAAVRTGEPIDPVLARVFEAMNVAPFLKAIRDLTGADDIVHVDAQATRYLPGHFLNAHTDRNEAAGRLYAYVLNLTPGWRAEWGGLLMFLDAPDAVDQVFTPRFNTLNVFRVPQAHAVSMVAPFAGAPRHSITGWWRSRAPA